MTDDIVNKRVQRFWCCAYNVLWLWVCGAVIYNRTNVLPYDAGCCLHNQLPLVLFNTVPVGVLPVMQDAVTVLMEC